MLVSPMRTAMLLIGAFLLLVASAVMAQAPDSNSEPPKQSAVGSISQLMVDVIYPTSNDIFYIFREPPTNDIQWEKARTSALTLAEAGNLLLIPSRSRDETWAKYAVFLREVGQKAYQAAVNKDEKAIEALNEDLNTACVQCHMAYHPAFTRGKGKGGVKGKAKQ